MLSTQYGSINEPLLDDNPHTARSFSPPQEVKTSWSDRISDAILRTLIAWRTVLPDALFTFIQQLPVVFIYTYCLSLCGMRLEYSFATICLVQAVSTILSTFFYPTAMWKYNNKSNSHNSSANLTTHRQPNPHVFTIGWDNIPLVLFSCVVVVNHYNYRFTTMLTFFFMANLIILLATLTSLIQPMMYFFRRHHAFRAGLQIGGYLYVLSEAVRLLTVFLLNDANTTTTTDNNNKAFPFTSNRLTDAIVGSRHFYYLHAITYILYISVVVLYGLSFLGLNQRYLTTTTTVLVDKNNDPKLNEDDEYRVVVIDNNNTKKYQQFYHPTPSQRQLQQQYKQQQHYDQEHQYDQQPKAVTTHRAKNVIWLRQFQIIPMLLITMLLLYVLITQFFFMGSFWTHTSPSADMLQARTRMTMGNTPNTTPQNVFEHTPLVSLFVQPQYPRDVANEDKFRWHYALYEAFNDNINPFTVLSRNRLKNETAPEGSGERNVVSTWGLALHIFSKSLLFIGVYIMLILTHRVNQEEFFLYLSMIEDKREREYQLRQDMWMKRLNRFRHCNHNGDGKSNNNDNNNNSKQKKEILGNKALHRHSQQQQQRRPSYSETPSCFDDDQHPTTTTTTTTTTTSYQPSTNHRPDLNPSHRTTPPSTATATADTLIHNDDHNTPDNPHIYTERLRADSTNNLLPQFEMNFIDNTTKNTNTTLDNHYGGGGDDYKDDDVDIMNNNKTDDTVFTKQQQQSQQSQQSQQQQPQQQQQQFMSSYQQDAFHNNDHDIMTTTKQQQQQQQQNIAHLEEYHDLQQITYNALYSYSSVCNLGLSFFGFPGLTPTPLLLHFIANQRAKTHFLPTLLRCVGIFNLLAMAGAVVLTRLYMRLIVIAAMMTFYASYHIYVSVYQHYYYYFHTHVDNHHLYDYYNKTNKTTSSSSSLRLVGSEEYDDNTTYQQYHMVLNIVTFFSALILGFIGRFELCLVVFKGALILGGLLSLIYSHDSLADLYTTDANEQDGRGAEWRRHHHHRDHYDDGEDEECPEDDQFKALHTYQKKRMEAAARRNDYTSL